MIDDLKLLELMTARMVHDLAGPVGAVNNSIEFFEEDNDDIKSKALSIIKSSSSESVLRLKYFRQAYGNLSDKEIASNELKHLIEEFLEKTKVKFSWQISEQGELDVLKAKVILNFVIMATNSMIYGGVLEVLTANNIFEIKFNADNYIFSDETHLLLTGDASNVVLSSSNIQVYYTFMILRKLKCDLEVHKNSQGIAFTFKH